MADETDRDAERLINELLTRVGMIMEDVGPTALLDDPYAGDLPARIGAVLTATKQMIALITAAQVLLND
jgi:hypothetical protein